MSAKSNKIELSEELMVMREEQPPEEFYNKSFLQIMQNSQENTCARVSFLIKLPALRIFSEQRTPLGNCFQN